ncbi:hypothetical protein AB4452_12690 [Vibrio lentus]|uniref:hypothetical protein n=1 Tax=Vibrio lentus TaxID=136468 RepID=UPI001F535337|nr:hypothetical protein [Vibrio lentus]
MNKTLQNTYSKIQLYIYGDQSSDILRVSEFVISKSKIKEPFSVDSASKTKELNGIGIYRIAEILREICLEPAGPNSMERFTNIDASNGHCENGLWALNPPSYYGYLTYQSNQHAITAYWIAIATLMITLLGMAVS